MKAIVIGATGATGRELVDLLLANPSVSQVQIFVRRPTGKAHPKLSEHLLDFARLDDARSLIEGDTLFSCLGTTRAQAGSKAAQYEIDYTYQLNFARLAQSVGVSQLVLVSSMGADSRSRSFYTRMKGELDEAVQSLGFTCLSILRPPLLLRQDMRWGEGLGACFLSLVNRLGLLRSYRAMPVQDLAKAMLKISLSAKNGVRIFEREDIWQVVIA